MLWDQIDRNKRRTALLFIGFAFIVFAVVWAFDAMFIGLGPVGASVLSVAVGAAALTFAWFSADRVVLSAMGVRPPRLDHPREQQLPGMVEAIALTAGIPTPQVYVVDDPAPNAFATGRTPDKGVVGFTTGLLDKMDRPQVEAVAAHEVSHIANRDSMVGVVAAVLVGVVIIITRLALRMMFYGGRRRGGRSGGGGGGNAVALVAGLAVLVIAPLFAMLLRSAISRRRESLADANAVRLTRNPDAMIGALEVLAGDHSSVDFAHGFAAHLWIEEPEDPQGPGMLDRLFATHPPIPDRIKALRAIAGHERRR